MFTSNIAGTQPRRAPVAQPPALPALHEEVIVTAFATATTINEVSVRTDKLADFEPIPQLKVRHGLAADQGTRGSMEDATTAILDFRNNLSEELALLTPEANSFFGVFDGHSGAAAALFASNNLHSYFANSLRAEELQTDAMQEAMVQAFLRTDSELWRASQDTMSADTPAGSGTTALTALVWGNQLLVANAGDCRAVLSRRGKAIDLTQDHKPSNIDEALRVKAAGGHISDGYLNGHLAVLRALGDHHYKDLKAPTGPSGAMEGPLISMEGPLIARPEVAVHDLLPEDEFILIACDGLWDVFKSQRAVEVARSSLREHNDPRLCSQQLVDEALKLNSTDNISVITICLTAAAPPKRTFSGHLSVQRTLSHEGLNRLGSALLSADDSRAGI